MRLLAPISALLLVSSLSTGLMTFQRRGYREGEYGGAREARTYPNDNDSGRREYSWSRLRYTMAGAGSGGYGWGRWASWSRDYPKADRGRVMVAICHNMHLGDVWEWADDPRYPEEFASLAFRLGINYVIYGMTH